MFCFSLHYCLCGDLFEVPHITYHLPLGVIMQRRFRHYWFAIVQVFVLTPLLCRPHIKTQRRCCHLYVQIKVQVCGPRVCMCIYTVCRVPVLCCDIVMWWFVRLFQVKMEREQHQTEIRDLQDQLSEMHDELDSAKKSAADGERDIIMVVMQCSLFQRRGEMFCFFKLVEHVADGNSLTKLLLNTKIMYINHMVKCSFRVS